VWHTPPHRLSVSKCLLRNSCYQAVASLIVHTIFFRAQQEARGQNCWAAFAAYRLRGVCVERETIVQYTYQVTRRTGTICCLLQFSQRKLPKEEREHNGGLLLLCLAGKRSKLKVSSVWRERGKESVRSKRGETLSACLIVEIKTC